MSDSVPLRSPLAGYVLALAVTGIATVAMLGAGLHREGDAFVLLALAVFLAAGWGGLGAGVFGGLLAAAAAEQVFPVTGPGPLLLRGGLFALAAVLGSTAPAWTRPARRRAEAHARELRRLNEALVRQKVELVVQADELRHKAAALERSNRELSDAAHEAGLAREAAEHAGAEARRAAALLDAFIDNAPTGFAFWDRELRYVRANRALAEIYGVPAERLSGAQVGTELPAHVEALRPMIAQVLHTRRPLLDIELAGPRAGAERTPRLWRASLFPLESGGEAMGAIGIVADITERHELEEQLRQAQKLEAVARVAGGIAHDFNNLLTVIRSYAEFLLETVPPGQPGREDVEEIRRGADRGSELSRQLLVFSRKQPLEPRVVDLNTVVRDVERMLRRVIGEDIRLTTSLEATLHSIRADPGQLEQVLMNLALNARDAMPEGGTLRIETANLHLDRGYADRHVDTQPGDYVQLVVSDTGIGMDRDMLDRIFEPFFTTKEKGKGTGLGLATVYGIVRQSGGSLTVSSEPGEGATFRLYFPSVADGVAPSAGGGGAAPEGGGAERILLVEDDVAVRAVARRILERGGYTVVEAGDGRAALHLVDGRSIVPDLLITDLIMPGMSGRELAERVTRRIPVIRVLYMSGYTEDNLAGHSAVPEGAAFLDKPFTPETLLRKVRQVLDASP